MQAFLNVTRAKPKICATRRAVVGRVGTSRRTIAAAIAGGGTASKLCARTANGPRKVIYGDASGAKRRTVWRPSSATTGTGTCARGRLLPIGTRPDLCGYQMSRRISSHGPIPTSTPSTRRLLDGVTVSISACDSLVDFHTGHGSSASASRACPRASCATTRSASGTTASVWN